MAQREKSLDSNMTLAAKPRKHNIIYGFPLLRQRTTLLLDDPPDFLADGCTNVELLSQRVTYMAMAAAAFRVHFCRFKRRLSEGRLKLILINASTGPIIRDTLAQKNKALLRAFAILNDPNRLQYKFQKLKQQAAANMFKYEARVHRNYEIRSKRNVDIEKEIEIREMCTKAFETVVIIYRENINSRKKYLHNREFDVTPARSEEQNERTETNKELNSDLIANIKPRSDLDKCSCPFPKVENKMHPRLRAELQIYVDSLLEEAVKKVREHLAQNAASAQANPESSQHANPSKN